jgi:hypothetical protein
MWAALRNAYGTEPKAAGEMIEDAKAGYIKKPKKGKALIDQTMTGRSEAAALRAAIVGYTSDRMDARYLGNKFNTDEHAIADGLRLCSDYDSHSKVNRWYVEPLRAPAAQELHDVLQIRNAPGQTINAGTDQGVPWSQEGQECFKLPTAFSARPRYLLVPDDCAACCYEGFALNVNALISTAYSGVSIQRHRCLLCL